MKLLFDQNLSYKLVALLADVFPGSAHVRDLGLERADDTKIWEFARERGYTIVSKDDDFHQRSFVYGHPPKAVWLRVGNCATERIAAILSACAADVATFVADPDAAFLAMSCTSVGELAAGSRRLRLPLLQFADSGIWCAGGCEGGCSGAECGGRRYDPSLAAMDRRGTVGQKWCHPKRGDNQCRA